VRQPRASLMAMRRSLLPLALRVRHASTAVVAPAVVVPGTTPVPHVAPGILRWARRDGKVIAQPMEPFSLYFNAAARSYALDAIDLDHVGVPTLDEHTHRIEVAFGKEGLHLRLALKQLCELKATDPSAWSAGLVAKAEDETAWMQAVKNNRANLSKIMETVKTDGVRLTGTFAGERLSHKSAEDAGSTHSSPGNGIRIGRYITFTPWDSRGMDGGDNASLLKRYATDLAAMDEDIAARETRIAGLKQKAKAFDAEVAAAKGYGQAQLNKLRAATDALQ